MQYEKLTPMMKQYIDVKSKNQDAILFYRLGDFYEMFMDDALVACKVLEIALTQRNAGLDQKVAMCGIPYHAAQPYIKKLIDSGFKVAICEQLEDPSASKGIVKRDVVKIITPGTNLQLDKNDYNYIMYLDNSQANYYYLALCDLSTGKLKANSIVKDKDKLYNEIMSYQIKELVVANNFDTSIFNDLIKTYKFLISFTAEVATIDKPIITTIEKPFQLSFSSLLNYIELMQHNSLDYYLEVEYHNNDNMKLDFSSKFNLELVSTIKNNDKYGTLFWYLDKTKTAMGARLLKEFIESPLLNQKLIEQRQEFVTALLKDYLNTEMMGNHLKNIYDLARIATKVGLGIVIPKELLWLQQSLINAAALVNKLQENNSLVIQTYLSQMDLLYDLQDLITTTICQDIIEGDRSKIINDGVDKQLDEYRHTLDESTTWLIDFETRQKKLTGIKSLKVKYNKVFGYYIEVSNANKDMIKDEYGYTRKQTLTNAERYINGELKEQESMILNAQENVATLEQELFNEFKDQLKGFTTKLQLLAQQLAYIDVMYAFYCISNQHGFTKPTFNQDYNIDIKDSFHPIIKEIDQERTFINNDFTIDYNTNVLIITGPNMGGKSTYMRQLALIVIMAQIGCFVPASKADIMLFDQIFTRIGASDDLIKGQSTFMVEMLEASNAILNATSNSLILFDEIGRGTATYDGMSIAYAILEYVSQQNKSKLLFSTHYHELTNLADVNSNIKNYHAAVLENNDEITFTYKIEAGSIDNSYGIHVAQLANLPDVIIKRAYQLLASFEKKGTTTLSQVEYIEVVDEKAQAIVDELKTVDVDSMRPVEALIYLEQLKNKVAHNHE